jgi:hypothetical protein
LGTTINSESRKRSRDILAIDEDAPSTHQSSKKSTGPLSNFRLDGPPILYERRVENCLIPHVRFYDCHADTVRDISYEIYKAEYGEMSTRWRELQNELEQLHGKRRRLEVLLDMEERKMKGGKLKVEKNAGPVHVERETSSSSFSCCPSSAAAAMVEADIGVGSATAAVAMDGVTGTGGTGKKVKETKKMKGAGSEASTAVTTTPLQSVFSLSCLGTSTPASMQVPGEQEYVDDNEIERICGQPWDDVGAVGQVGEGCDDDDFTRMCDAVWDSSNT